MQNDKQTPPDWVLIEAAKRSKWTVLDVPTLRAYHGEYSAPYRALCDMIEKYEQPPVDRKLLCARAAKCDDYGYQPSSKRYKEVMSGQHDKFLEPAFALMIRAIELWEEGFGE